MAIVYLIGMQPFLFAFSVQKIYDYIAEGQRNNPDPDEEEDEEEMDGL